jgi:uncharacterized membrane protein
LRRVKTRPADLIASEHALLDIEQQNAEVNDRGETARTAAAKAVGVPPEALDAIARELAELGRTARSRERR